MRVRPLHAPGAVHEQDDIELLVIKRKICCARDRLRNDGGPVRGWRLLFSFSAESAARQRQEKGGTGQEKEKPVYTYVVFP